MFMSLPPPGLTPIEVIISSLFIDGHKRIHIQTTTTHDIRFIWFFLCQLDDNASNKMLIHFLGIMRYINIYGLFKKAYKEISSNKQRLHKLQFSNNYKYTFLIKKVWNYMAILVDRYQKPFCDKKNLSIHFFLWRYRILCWLIFFLTIGKKITSRNF